LLLLLGLFPAVAGGRCSCTVKKTVPSRDVTDQTLSGREKTKFFPPRKSLISDIPAGDGKTANSFLQCAVAPGAVILLLGLSFKLLLVDLLLMDLQVSLLFMLLRVGFLLMLSLVGVVGLLVPAIMGLYFMLLLQGLSFILLMLGQ
jgi:hypothetical protein